MYDQFKDREVYITYLQPLRTEQTYLMAYGVGGKLVAESKEHLQLSEAYTHLDISPDCPKEYQERMRERITQRSDWEIENRGLEIIITKANIGDCSTAKK